MINVVTLLLSCVDEYSQFRAVDLRHGKNKVNLIGFVYGLALVKKK